MSTGYRNIFNSAWQAAPAHENQVDDRGASVKLERFTHYLHLEEGVITVPENHNKTKEMG